MSRPFHKQGHDTHFHLSSVPMFPSQLCAHISISALCPHEMVPSAQSACRAVNCVPLTHKLILRSCHNTSSYVQIHNNKIISSLSDPAMRQSRALCGKQAAHNLHPKSRHLCLWGALSHRLLPITAGSEQATACQGCSKC